MRLLKPFLASTSLFLIVAAGTFAQDDTDLIDDLSKERKEAAKEGPPRAKRKANLKGAKPQNDDDKQRPQQRNVDLIDDLLPERKQAAQNAARKTENAIPDNLADALARALRSSPAILVADAKLRQAQAELNEVRLGVVQELTLAFQRRASNKTALVHHEAAVKSGQDTPLTSTNVQQAIMEDETRILYLLGVGAEHPAETGQAAAGAGPKMGGAGMMGPMGAGMGAMQMGMMPAMGGGMGAIGMGPQMGGGMGGMAAQMGSGMGGMMPAGVTGQMGLGMMKGGMGGGSLEQGQGGPSAVDGKRLLNVPQNVRTFLDKRLDCDFDKQELNDVLFYLQQAGESEVCFVIERPEEWKNPQAGDDWNAITLSLKQVTVRSILQALADLHHCAFVFRDYGILVLGPDVESTEAFESFKAAGTPMIAPPVAGAPGGGSAMAMPGMMGAAPMGAAAPPAAEEKRTAE